MRALLDTTARVEQYNKLTGRDMCLGDAVEFRVPVCPTCFTQHAADTDEAVECFRMFPPVARVTVIGQFDCPVCDNAMLMDTFSDGRKVIMCCNPHCPGNGTCYKMPMIKLERLFE